jgi:adenylosuccinate synthase
LKREELILRHQETWSDYGTVTYAAGRVASLEAEAARASGSCSCIYNIYLDI